ncbi:anaphase promoting complex subunit 5 KNAG_0G02630 [Huiozyma naganishii CBS 8797]|uniref:Anaphase-promoting complex subunit 5 n=1 Tax=Huiozyma naganishii (strain ATCC MYA-139 / BCRC 22969 / CBS 8797 / KCTC 17520 / NBRC 10181 / NCYC 3082 / Yp74L-3) TaxID=1071383 RepID=J7S832_HUIN7|nr:hypothetical protein KNAG_0G02630 [Kazachstania naganishii CBS 8797]CCK71319.1 hypothetical protein KNAG_0G02630 [Kazachstania naganishii CBS 8797]
MLADEGAPAVREQFVVTTTLTPYDVAVLALIQLHLSQELKVPLRCILVLVSGTLTPQRFKGMFDKQILYEPGQEPLLPVLSSVVRCLMEHGPTDKDTAVLKLLKTLKQIQLFEHIVLLIRHLKGLNITRGSYLGQYIDNCSTVTSVSTFDDRNALMDNLKHFYQNFIDCADDILLGKLSQFQCSIPIWNNDQVHDNLGEDKEMIDIFKGLTQGLKKDLNSAGTIMVSQDHLQNILNAELQRLIEDEAPNPFETERLNKLIDNLSLQDLAVFPTVHMLNYLHFVQEHRYQDALDSLHSYYDYMLAKNSQADFHISLLSLGLFHLKFNDKEAPVSAFLEAFKIARDNRDVKTLNLIHLAILKYIEEHPRESVSLQDKVNKVIGNLKKHSGNNSVLIFEGAYQAETLIALGENSDVVHILECAFQFLTIALQQDQSKRWSRESFAFCCKMWDVIGYQSVTKVYRQFYDEDPLDLQIDNALKTRDLGEMKLLLPILELPTLKYEQQMKLQLVEIRYILETGSLSQAMEKVCEYIDECTSPVRDNRWIFEFEVAECEVLIKGGVGSRSLPLLAKMIERSRINGNPLQSSRCLVLLSEVLFQLGKFEETFSLLRKNLNSLLQFEEVKLKAAKLFAEVHEKLIGS